MIGNRDRSKRSRDSKSNALAFATMCLLLNKRPHAKKQLAEGTGLTIGTVTAWMRILRRKHLVYIAHYHRDGVVGQWAAMWAWGLKIADAVRPKPQTMAQYSRNSRIRKKVLANGLRGEGPAIANSRAATGIPVQTSSDSVRPDPHPDVGAHECDMVG